MANLSLREAVKHFDVSRPTLLKSLKNGKVSGVKDGKGQWTIDPAELTRVYQPRESDPDKVGKPFPVKLSKFDSPLSGEVEALRQQLADAEQRAAVAEAQAEERSARISDMTEERDRWRQQATGLLADLRAAHEKAAPAEDSSRSWWRRLIG